MEYKSRNGCRGVLSGRELTIYVSGIERFHSQRSSVTNYEELKETVDTFPDFWKMLKNENGRRKHEGMWDMSCTTRAEWWGKSTGS